MSRIALLALFALGCHTATAIEAPPSPAAVEADWAEAALADVRGTTDATVALSKRVASLSTSDRTDARVAAAYVVANCPYNRASVQLALDLDRAASRYGPERFNHVIDLDWQRLRTGLAAHVEVFDHLGIDLEPQPLSETSVQLAAVMGEVDAMDAMIKLGVDDAVERLNLHTGDQWPLKTQLLGWRNALEKMEPHVANPEIRAEIRQMIDLISAHVPLYC